MSERSGHTSRPPFAFFDHDSSSWKTWQRSFLPGSLGELPITWPASGMTCDGRAYELPRSALRTGVSEFSSLLGTPRTSSTNGPGMWEASERGPRGRLEGQIDQLLKTPTAQLAVNGGSQHPDKRTAGGHGPTLADQIEHLLPTPRATDGEKGGPNQQGSSGDLMLPSAVQLLPTPDASMEGNRGGTRARSAEALASGKHQANLNDLPRLLPTPSAGNFNDGESLESWEVRRQKNLAKGINGNGQGTPLSIAVHGASTNPRLAVGNTSQDELPLFPPSEAPEVASGFHPNSSSG